MGEISLLLIEDNESDADIVKNAVSDFNEEDEGLQINLQHCKNIQEANPVLSSKKIDAAIIDLKLGATDTSEGVNLVEEILKNNSILTFVYSGTTGYTSHLDEKESNFFKIYTKGTHRISNIIEEVVILYKTGITQLLSTGEIHNEFNRLIIQIFWNHISNSIDFWKQNNDKQSLHRYVQSHILEYYKFDSSGQLADYSPAEIYITPPINKEFHTGDIVKIEKKGHWIILSPACDMVVQAGRSNRKAEYVTLVKLVPIENLIGDDRPLSNSKKDKLEKALRGLRYFSLPFPKFNQIPSSYIDFQQILSMKPNDLNTSDVSRIGTISDLFIKDIIFQFSSYYSRQGTPNIDSESLYKFL
jgi:hypothetical protein